MKYIALLGRQPHIGLAELERRYGSVNIAPFGPSTAVVETSSFSLDRLGGTRKAGRVIMDFPQMSWAEVNKKITQHYTTQWAALQHKQTLGISVYDWPEASPKAILKLGLSVKNSLKKSGVSLRLIPNTTPDLSTATSHHNKLGLSPNKVELLIVRARHGIIVAESIGAQNITAYARRDQARPKRDAFVGMLPPKLAQIMINLAGEVHPATSPTKTSATLLDPFCGTGVILQEAALMGYAIYGTDLSDKMISYSTTNLDWLQHTHRTAITSTLHQADAMNAQWQPPIDAVVCEGYLGQPFSAPPSPQKLRQVVGNCDHIIGTFLANIHPQLRPGTPLCIAVPAWRSQAGTFTHLPLTSQLAGLGYTRVSLQHVKPADLLYYRTDQVVARELLVLVRI